MLNLALKEHIVNIYQQKNIFLPQFNSLREHRSCFFH